MNGERGKTDPAAPLISVLLPITLPWASAEASVRSLLVQRDAPAFEILILNGTSEEMEDRLRDARVRWFHIPGSNTFQLRAAGIAAARGAIIAVTEDHCVAAPDWVAAIARAHDGASSVAILGATVNHPESARSAMDRANFVVTFAAQNATRIDLKVRPLPAPTNLSFKRDALESPEVQPADLEYRWLQELSKAGEIGVARSVVLQHNQSLGATAPAVHLASGRSFGGSVHAAPWRHQLQWWAGFPFLPLRLLALTIPDLVRGAGGKRTFADVVCLVILISANAGGQFLGAVLGAGTSRRRL